MLKSITQQLKSFPTSTSFTPVVDRSGVTYLCQRVGDRIRVINGENGKVWDLTSEQFNGLFKAMAKKEAA